MGFDMQNPRGSDRLNFICLLWWVVYKYLYLYCCLNSDEIVPFNDNLQANLLQFGHALWWYSAWPSSSQNILQAGNKRLKVYVFFLRLNFQILNLASVTHPILIFFDNLKIFFVDEHKNGGSWLPCPLPKYCKIILSFQQEETDNNLARKFVI